LVSIITPAYNCEKYIAECIDSVINQTYKNWEMIIVDDCSTDDTCAVVERFSSSDPRIRLIRRTENGGPARTRNTALKAANGRYIAFLDSDDLWLPKKLERQLAFMEIKGAALSYTQYRRFTEDSKQPGPLISVPSFFTYRQLLQNTGIACLTVIIDTKFTGPIEMPLVQHEDYALWLKILKRGIVAQGLMEDLARYRITETSVSGNKVKSAIWVWRIYRDIEKLSIPDAARCFINYAWHAYGKRKA
jgi:teichuronic acid biosynthesis glycosyltransferase TuaG